MKIITSSLRRSMYYFEKDMAPFAVQNSITFSSFSHLISRVTLIRVTLEYASENGYTFLALFHVNKRIPFCIKDTIEIKIMLMLF